MTLGSGQFVIAMSERQVSMILDALDHAEYAATQNDISTTFAPLDFSELGSQFRDRFMF